jgi:hypothetical protein
VRELLDALSLRSDVFLGLLTGNYEQCARTAGIDCLAVATGGYGVDALRAAGAGAVVESLADTRAVVRWLAGPGG